MARKHVSKKKGSTSRPRAFNRKESSMKRWNTVSDIPLDEEDQFHSTRDRILLDGENPNSDDEGDEDEVFALEGMDDASSEEEDEEEQEADDDDMDADLQVSSHTKKKRSKGKVQSSDEESESESEEEGWGRSKAAYYASNSGQIDSEDEEANEMEEQEAKRLQAKARDTLADDDFGLDDSVEGLVEGEFGKLEEPTQSTVVPLPQDKQSIIRHLERTNPEALALARDWDDTARNVVKSQDKISRLERENPNGLALGMMHLYNETLLIYATTLAFYLHLRSSEKYAARPELLQTHPIMSRLLTLKQSVSTLEDLDFGLSDSEGEDEDDDDDESSLDMDEVSRGEIDDKVLKKVARMDRSELEELLAEMRELTAEDDMESAKPKKESKKYKREEKQIQEPPKKKRKTKSDADPSLPVFDLEEPTFPTKSKTPSRHSANTDTDAYGELMTLHAADAADKAARKKSLRFHTAKIESASARRERARANAGGDDDIPWKERKREQELRRKKELEKTRGMGGDDLDDEEPEPREVSGKKRRRDDDDGEGANEDVDESADGYYELVKRKSKAKKDQKKAEYEATQAVARERLVMDDTADGPRSLTRAILKNKGLTPHRSKSVRNPRVKKRQRYEQAKKKVSSQKAVYKGGVGASGRYEGEKSGISKVIKSTRLS